MGRYPYTITQGPGTGHSAGAGMEPIDFATPSKTPVAVPGGIGPWTVTVSQDLGATSYGQWVEAEHGSLRVRYAHLSLRTVSVNDVLDGGTLIGLTGNSGGSTGPHLHFEVSDDVFRWAKFIWEVVSVLTKQDKEWITSQIHQQNADLLNALTVGRLRGGSIEGDKATDVIRERVKANNLKELRIS